MIFFLFGLQCKAIVEDERSAGNRVPESADGLIRGLVPGQKAMSVIMYFDYFEIAARYVETVLVKAVIDGTETEYIEQFLARIKFFILRNTPSLQIIHLEGLGV